MKELGEQWECSHCHMLPGCHAACANKPTGPSESLLPSLIPPYRWLSWWLLTRSFLSGPFLPPHRARRLQGGHGRASSPQRGGYYNCSLRIYKPRCPSEAAQWCHSKISLFYVFLSCRDKREIQIRGEKIWGKNWTRVLHTTSHLPMETVIRICAALIINKLWLIHTDLAPLTQIFFLSGVRIFLSYYQLIFLFSPVHEGRTNIPTMVAPLHVKHRCLLLLHLLLAESNISGIRQSARHWLISPDFCRTMSNSEEVSQWKEDTRLSLHHTHTQTEWSIKDMSSVADREPEREASSPTPGSSLQVDA